MRVITVSRRPLARSVAQNALKFGTGGINIDGCRIATSETLMMGSGKLLSGLTCGKGAAGVTCEQHSLGRWPANLILQHQLECQCVGEKEVRRGGGPGRATKGSGGFWSVGEGGPAGYVYGGAEGKERVASWLCAPACPVEALNQESGVIVSPKATFARPGYGETASVSFVKGGGVTTPENTHGGTGGAARFFKQVKA